jgi:hypothetical protein
MYGYKVELQLNLSYSHNSASYTGNDIVGNNWIELGLTKDEDESVRHGAELWKATYVETIDNIFAIARGIDILRRRHDGMGVKGALGDALVQYGYTARDRESPMDKAIRANLKKMLEHENEVRTWWNKKGDDGFEKRKRHWVSASTIYAQWNKSRKPPVDPNAPKKPSPLRQERETNIALQEQLHAANKLLKTADGGNLFTAESPAEHIAESIAGMILTSPKMTPSKMRAIATHLNKLAKNYEARTKQARPKDRRRDRVVGS